MGGICSSAHREGVPRKSGVMGKSQEALGPKEVEGRGTAYVRRPSPDGLEHTTEKRAISYASIVDGRKKDEDRVIVLPSLLPDVMAAIVCDGHGMKGEGQIVADKAVEKIPQLLQRSLAKTKSRGEKGKEQGAEHYMLQLKEVEHSVTEAFQAFQDYYEEEYRKLIEEPAIALKKQIEAENNVELQTLLPMGGGCTCTTVLINGDRIFLGWVGDSTAVLAKEKLAGDGRASVEAVKLTSDHDTENTQEATRAEAVGGAVFGRYVATELTDGILQLLRSLGDIPFHRPVKNYKDSPVIATPETKELKIGEDDKFILIASDGLWNAISPQHAVEFVQSRMMKLLSGRKDPSDKEMEAVLAASLRCLKEEAVKVGKLENRVADDISIILISISVK